MNKLENGFIQLIIALIVFRIDHFIVLELIIISNEILGGFGFLENMDELIKVNPS